MSLFDLRLEKHKKFKNTKETLTSLYDLKIGQSGIIEKVTGNSKLAKRLLDLGCIEGTEVTVKGVAPLGDPLIINFRGFDLAIRKKDAKNIFLTN